MHENIILQNILIPGLRCSAGRESSAGLAVDHSCSWNEGRQAVSYNLVWLACGGIDMKPDSEAKLMGRYIDPIHRFAMANRPFVERGYWSLMCLSRYPAGWPGTPLSRNGTAASRRKPSGRRCSWPVRPCLGTPTNSSWNRRLRDCSG